MFLKKINFYRGVCQVLFCKIFFIEEVLKESTAVQLERPLFCRNQ